MRKGLAREDVLHASERVLPNVLVQEQEFALNVGAQNSSLALMPLLQKLRMLL